MTARTTVAAAASSGVWRTTVTFDRIATIRPPALVFEGRLDEFDVVEELTVRLPALIGFPLTGVEIDVDLPTGAVDGRVWVMVSARPIGEGWIRIVEVPVEPELPPAPTYPDGRVVLAGDVVSLGRLGSALWEVVEISERHAWLRNLGHAGGQRLEPVGRLQLLERRTT